MSFKKRFSHAMRRVRSFIRRYSIRQRLLVLELVQLALLLSWCAYSIGSAFRDTNILVSNKNYEELNHITESMGSSLRALENVSRYPMYQTTGSITFTYRYLSNRRYYRDQVYQYYEDLQQKCHQLNLQYPEVDLISICDSDGEAVYVKSMEALYSTVKTQKGRDWFQQTMEGKGIALYWDAAAFAGTEFEMPKNRVYLSRAIVNVDRFERVGLILASADLDGIYRYFDSAKLFGEQRVGVYDAQGRRMLGDLETDENLGALLARAQAGNKSLKWHGASDGSLMLHSAQGDMLYSYSVSLPGYVAVIRTPYRLILAQSLSGLGGMTAIWCGLIVLLGFCTAQMTLSIVQPLQKLSGACQRLERGNFSVEIRDQGQDEITDFTHSFNSMAQMINTLIKEGYEKDILKGQLELQMLRSQINPHFLYNTLESIRVTAYLAGQKHVSEMATLLGKTLRYGVSTPNETVTLARELENLQDYIRLQNIRYQGKIQFILSVADGLMKMQVPRLLLQPLVENAVYHGIDGSEPGGVIHVLGFQQGAAALFQVVDNGRGMQAQELQRLTDYIEGKNNSYTSIGLKNVQRRVKLTYGEAYGLSLRSAPGKGMAVTVTLPLGGPEISEDRVRPERAPQERTTQPPEETLP